MMLSPQPKAPLRHLSLSFIGNFKHQATIGLLLLVLVDSLGICDNVPDRPFTADVDSFLGSVYFQLFYSVLAGKSETNGRKIFARSIFVFSDT